MTIDIEELERLAKAATQSRWRMVWPVMDQNREDGEPVPVYGVVGPSDSTEMVGAVPIGYEEDSRFIAAANPQTVIELCGEVRRLRERDAGTALGDALVDLQSTIARIPAASDLAIALRELRERRNNYAARHASMVASQAVPEVIASYEKTLAEVDAAIAAVERLVGR